jgi:hypothetical protein
MPDRFRTAKYAAAFARRSRSSAAFLATARISLLARKRAAMAAAMTSAATTGAGIMSS